MYTLDTKNIKKMIVSWLAKIHFRGLRVTCAIIALILPLIIVTVYDGTVYGTAYEPEQMLRDYAPVLYAAAQERPQTAQSVIEHVPSSTIAPPISGQDASSFVAPSVSGQDASSFVVPPTPRQETTSFATPPDHPISYNHFLVEHPEYTVQQKCTEHFPDELETLPPEPPPLPEPTRVAYLTIDDGPTRGVTDRMLDILKQEGIRATFFILPHRSVNDLFERIIAEGHEIGNHSFSHVYSRVYQSDLDEFRSEVERAQEFMLHNFGYEMRTFRFPGGAMSHGSGTIEPRREILAELGLRDFDWHIDSGDARAGQIDRSAAGLTANVLNNTRNRNHLIILMHDSQGKSTTVAALPMIIAGLREQGYRFDVISNFPLNRE